ncbi:MAG: GspE/PulE family protein [Puniceicoccaceae bacterium]
MLSKILVPDPIGKAAWSEAVLQWESLGGQESLLAWLIRQGVVDETVLIDALQTATGVPLTHPAQGAPQRNQPPQSGLLEQLGFVYLGRGGHFHLVAGGPNLPPSLEQVLGSDAVNWQWVLLHPIRSESGRKVDQSDGDEYAIAAGHHWLDDLIQGLTSRGASDIHFEFTLDRLEVRYHSGRSMLVAGHWEGERAREAIQLLKSRAGLTGTAPGMPGDGRLELRGIPGQLSARLSHVTTTNGESVVLRIPRPGLSVRPLTELGLPPRLVEECMDSASADPGLILCCGPTGSGKTTTLYGLLHELSSRDLKIITIEDPVEQELPGIVQSPVNQDRDWTFASAARAFLRQDPDVIMVGEIRDAASASAACRAALSGHAVLSTMHARNEEAALQRLLAWGVTPGVLADSVRLVMNQRLHVESTGNRLKPAFSWQTFNPSELHSMLEEPACR